MGASINTFKIYTEFVRNKIQIGNSLPIPDFNAIAHQAQMQVFEKDRAIFLATQVTSDFLEVFLEPLVTSVPPTGILNYPSDFEHTASIRSYYVRPGGKSGEISVDPVKNRDWGDIASSQLQQPTQRFPKYTEFSDSYRFLPRDIGTVMIDYFRTPTAPIWGYSMVSGRAVYDPATSTDFDFPEFAVNNVASVFFQLTGMNLREGDLMNFANQFKQETNSQA